MFSDAGTGNQLWRGTMDVNLGGSFGNYSTSSHNINIDSGADHRAVVMAHEFGHHAAWTYGLDSPSGCTANSNEGRAVHEMMADAFAMIFLADEGVLDVAYNADTIDMQSMSQHILSGDIVVDGSNGCSPSFLSSGNGFLQAIWELLYGFDCSLQDCTNARGYSSYIWTETSQEAAISSVGYLLGVALAETPDNPDMVDVTQAFRDGLTFFGQGTRNKVSSVLTHHGR